MYNFGKEEWACKCGKCNKDFYDMNPETIQKFEAARIIAGISFKINSGMRCMEHNLSIGGKKDSSHTEGYAGDIKATNSRERFIIVDSLLKAGFKRIGIAKTFIHADDDPIKDECVIWVY